MRVVWKHAYATAIVCKLTRLDIKDRSLSGYGLVAFSEWTLRCLLLLQQMIGVGYFGYECVCDYLHAWVAAMVRPEWHLKMAA